MSLKANDKCRNKNITNNHGVDSLSVSDIQKNNSSKFKQFYQKWEIVRSTFL